MKQETVPFTVTLLGTGTSTGVPLLLCECKVCRSKNPKNQRTRASAWIRSKTTSLIIDTSSDFRAQALRYKIQTIDGVLFTHPHSDHISGMDDLRAYNFVQKNRIPLYGNEWTCHDLPGRFPYIFNHDGPVEGGGIPRLDLNLLPTPYSQFHLGDLPILPISVSHGSKECVAYRIDSFAYLTDCSYIPQNSIEQLKNLDVLILDCVRIKPHRTHLNLSAALDVVNTLRPKRTFLTHLGHEFDHQIWQRKLPKGVQLAYDGQKLKIG